MIRDHVLALAYRYSFYGSRKIGSLWTLGKVVIPATLGKVIGLIVPCAHQLGVRFKRTSLDLALF